MSCGPVDQGLGLLVVAELAMVQRHPEGRNEPRVAPMVNVARISSDPFGGVAEGVFDLMSRAQYSRVIRL